MTREEEFELALAQRKQQGKDARLEMHARLRSDAAPVERARRMSRGERRLASLDATFARLREEARHELP